MWQMRALMQEETIRDIKAKAAAHGIPEYRFIALILAIGIARYCQQEMKLKQLREEHNGEGR